MVRQGHKVLKQRASLAKSLQFCYYYEAMNFLFSLLLGLGLPGMLAYIYHVILNFPLLPVWLAGVNLMLFALMGKDKFAAKNKKSRTPELTLLLLTFAGGTPAFFGGRWLFAHKKSKESFNHALYAVIGAQAFSVWYFWGWIWPQLKAIF
jgi:uncharacterized membrane protein YsdA (DUF1294 family)